MLHGALGMAVAAAVRPALHAGRAGAVADGFALLTGVGGNVVVVQDDRRRRARRQRRGRRERRECSISSRRRTGGRRVHTLFNTHWHLEQVGGNEALGNAGANIVAHEKTRLRLATPYYLPERDAYQPAMPVQAQPTESFYTTGSTTIGGKRIEYGHLLEAHTDGDAYVYFRDANVIAVGDAIAPRPRHRARLVGRRLARRPRRFAEAAARSHGRADDASCRATATLVGRAAVQAEHDMCKLLFDRFFERIRKGETNEDMLAAGIMEGTGRTWNDPAKFVHDAHKGFWGHNNTLSHDIV